MKTTIVETSIELPTLHTAAIPAQETVQEEQKLSTDLSVEELNSLAEEAGRGTLSAMMTLGKILCDLGRPEASCLLFAKAATQIEDRLKKQGLTYSAKELHQLAKEYEDLPNLSVSDLTIYARPQRGQAFQILLPTRSPVNLIALGVE